MTQKPIAARYDGYSSCPLVTEVGKVILAEFGYDGKLLPSFPVNPAKERRSMWFLKRYLLPKLYWYGMLRGLL
jgi:sulfide:quinone oxidoreductase